MKYALIFGLVLGVIWLWRSSRKKMANPPATRAQVAKSTEVVACAVCSVHLPRTEAVACTAPLRTGSRKTIKARGFG